MTKIQEFNDINFIQKEKYNEMNMFKTKYYNEIINPNPQYDINLNTNAIENIINKKEEMR